MTIVLRYRNTIVEQVTAKTVNHNIKLAKMLFRAARRDDLIADDPPGLVDTVKLKPIFYS
jgi:hypothetical protein